MPHTWPLIEQYSEHGHQLGAHYGCEIESSMFDEHGGIVDCSVGDLTESPKFEEMLLTSKLVGTGALQQFSDKKAYVIDLANTPVTFKVWRQQQQVALSYAYTLLGGHLTLGAAMPMVAAKREMTYRTEVTDAVRSQLEKGIPTTGRNADFVSLYGYDADGFFDDILRKKNMRFEQTHRITTIGDLELFGYAAMRWRFIERLQLGASLTLPYAKKRDLSVFHPAHAGNGGFVMMRGHANIVFKKKWLGYPHFSCAIEMGMPASVARRVPKIITVAAGGSLPSDLATVKLVKPKVAGDISEPESTIPELSQHITSLSLQPGVKTSFRFGTVILPCTSRCIQADLAYELSFKTGDRLHGKAASDEWYMKPFSSQPHQVIHRLHGALVYQPVDHVHWHIGGFATVMGQSTAQRYGWRAGLSCQW